MGSNSGVIYDSYAMGIVNGGSPGDFMGGLIGSNSNLVIRCYATGTVWGNSNIGGLAGSNRGRFFDCYATGNVNSTNIACGGLVGLINESSVPTISNTPSLIGSCYATGNVLGNNDVGGLVGRINLDPAGASEIYDSYATGAVNGSNRVGGLIGRNYSFDLTYSEVRHCYATGAVNGITDVGGLVGNKDSLGVYIKCFWNTTTNPTLAGIGNGSDPDVIGGPTSFLQTQSTFTNAGWDFSDTWWMCGNGIIYPRLRFEVPFLDFDYSSGNGSIGNPFWISNANQLHTLGVSELALCYWDKHFKLVTDLDMTGAAMQPIGNTNIAFTGTFDGNGHTLSNLTINVPTTFNVGLFGKMNGPDSGIYDLTLIEPDITGHYNVGSLAGRLSDGEISGCSVIEGNLNGNYFVGGLVGYNDGTIHHCYATARVIGYQKSQGGSVGGLVGANFGGTINHCWTTATVSGIEAYVGGLTGLNSYGTITECYATGSVTGSDVFVGGLVGGMAWSTISRCYASGIVIGTDSVGGLVGWSASASNINSYASAVVTGTTGKVGGLIGSGFSTYSKCYWSTSLNPTLTGIGDGSDPDVIGESTTTLQIQSTFTASGWDFQGESANGTDDIWRMCVDGVDYPYLSWQYDEIGDWECPNGVNLIDFSYFAGYWLEQNCQASNECAGTNLDLSGDVGPADLLLWLANWLAGI